MGGALKEGAGVDLRVLPGKNDVSRTLPLRQGKAGFASTGVGSYMTQEGVLDFGTKAWGPQPIRVLLAANGQQNQGVAAAADSGIKSLADLKGRRVAWVVGGPSLNNPLGAMLAFAGLTWDDVEKVEFGGFGSAWEGMINDQVDACFGTTTTGPAYQAEASPRGVLWLPVPHDDAEGWKRLKEKAPYFIPQHGTEGATMSKEHPHEGATYPYPVLITYEKQDEDTVYALTRALVELFPKYKDSVSGINGWALEHQRFDWSVPFHNGAVRYFKELDMWTDEREAHNASLLQRQDVLQKAWQEIMDQNPSDADFPEAWLRVRAQRLQEAGMEVVYEPAA